MKLHNVNPFVIVAFTTCIGATALCFAGCQQGHSLSNDELKSANYGALDFAQKYGATSLGCSSLDSEPDSYVTCTMKDTSGKAITLSCGYGEASGCKLK